MKMLEFWLKAAENVLVLAENGWILAETGWTSAIFSTTQPFSAKLQTSSAIFSQIQFWVLFFRVSLPWKSVFVCLSFILFFFGRPFGHLGFFVAICLIPESSWVVVVSRGWSWVVVGLVGGSRGWVWGAVWGASAFGLRVWRQLVKIFWQSMSQRHQMCTFKHFGASTHGEKGFLSSFFVKQAHFLFLNLLQAQMIVLPQELCLLSVEAFFFSHSSLRILKTCFRSSTGTDDCFATRTLLALGGGGFFQRFPSQPASSCLFIWSLFWSWKLSLLTLLHKNSQRAHQLHVSSLLPLANTLPQMQVFERRSNRREVQANHVS